MLRVGNPSFNNHRCSRCEPLFISDSMRFPAGSACSSRTSCHLRLGMPFPPGLQAIRGREQKFRWVQSDLGEGAMLLVSGLHAREKVLHISGALFNFHVKHFIHQWEKSVAGQYDLGILFIRWTWSKWAWDYTRCARPRFDAPVPRFDLGSGI
jgi:hypothetical protein